MKEMLCLVIVCDLVDFLFVDKADIVTWYTFACLCDLCKLAYFIFSYLDLAGERKTG